MINLHDRSLCKTNASESPILTGWNSSEMSLMTTGIYSRAENTHAIDKAAHKFLITNKQKIVK